MQVMQYVRSHVYKPGATNASGLVARQSSCSMFESVEPAADNKSLFQVRYSPVRSNTAFVRARLPLRVCPRRSPNAPAFTGKTLGKTCPRKIPEAESCQNNHAYMSRMRLTYKQKLGHSMMACALQSLLLLIASFHLHSSAMPFGLSSSLPSQPQTTGYHLVTATATMQEMKVN